MKNIFLSLLTIFAVVGTATAQDAPVNRSLSFYLDVASGELAEKPGFNSDTDTSRLFAGNEYEIGAVYSQNFATVPWLTLSVKALVVGGQKNTYDSETGDYLGNSGYSMFPWATPRAMLGLNFGGYTFIGMDTRGLIANENYYSVALPGNGGAFTFSTVLEFWAVPQVLISETAPDGTIYGQGTTVVDLLSLNVQYGVNFAANWSFWTKVAVRFNGDKGRDQSAELFFNDGFNLRWENNIHWNVTPKFYMYGRVRYQLLNVASTRDLAVDHAVSLHVGLGYSFDFSNN